MHNEQVFTPEHVVDTMFEELEYKGNNIRKKHIIDNSCGNGAILKKVVRTYINVCIMCGLPKEKKNRILKVLAEWATHHMKNSRLGEKKD